MKNNSREILIYVFIITFVFLSCQRDEIIEIKPMVSLQLEIKSSQYKIEFPDTFVAKIEILQISQTDYNKPVKTDSITFVRQDLGNHRSQGSIEVPLETYFIIAIYANIDEIELHGKTDTIFISTDTDQALVSKVYLTTGHIIIDECVVAGVSLNSALVSSKIIDNGGKDIVEYGFAWTTDNNAAIDNNIGSLSENSDIMGSFQRLIEGLNPNTTYYIAAFASNGSEVVYSERVSFSTAANTTPVVLTTNPIVGVTSSSATASATFNDNGGRIISEKGFVWATYSNPEIGNNEGVSFEGVGSNDFSSTLESLAEVTTYYVRSYVETIEGEIYYGNEVSFITLASTSAVILSTDPILGITSNSATASATFTDDGGQAIAEKGFVWATYTNPEVANNEGVSFEGGGVSDFSSSLSGLLDGTVYYVRSYAETAEGEVFYGNEVSFTTVLLTPPQTINFFINEVLLHSAKIIVNIGSDGGSNIVSKGVIFSQTPNPDIDNNEGMTDEGGGVAQIESLVSGLNAGVVYYAKCYAANDVGVAYSEEFNFTTLTIGDIGPGGGIIFYDDGVIGGMEVGDVPAEIVIQWGCSSLLANTPSSIVGSGLSNTQTIIEFHNGLTDYVGNPVQCDAANDGTIAAFYCDSYSQNSYDDWFLPSLDELFLIYTNLHAFGIGDFNEDFYWSSTETDAINAKAIDFWKGTELDMSKTSSFWVRPVRKL
ncbi:MAG: hypothetical protein JXR36_00305 [Bacteroidales bacterium]|nr:hypothetical protein [Bacteroidales bacterium]